ncbi:MAG TPA: radical SAM protein [Chloroflexota bacterium]|nr:radical SAM protein [Chloroflexota bacterium]
MDRAGVVEVRCKSAINRVQGMPFRWSLNPYAGCQHDCQYCYARVTHRYRDLGAADFARRLFAKTNLPEVLRDEFRRPGWKHESVVIGTATDPYQPLEGTYRITRRCLEVFLECGNPGSITTKGTLIVRDVDLLAELARETRFTVHFSLISLDAGLIRHLEPGAPPPGSRLRAIERLAAAGVPVSLFLMPIVPGLTDRPESLAAVVRAGAERGAFAVWPGALRLAPGVKEWFLDFLAANYPRLLASYQRGYATGANPPPAYRERVEARVAEARATIELRRDARRECHRVGQQYVLPLGVGKALD